jgi:hypothetical protein
MLLPLLFGRSHDSPLLILDPYPGPRPPLLCSSLRNSKATETKQSSTRGTASSPLPPTRQLKPTHLPRLSCPPPSFYFSPCHRNKKTINPRDSKSTPAPCPLFTRPLLTLRPYSPLFHFSPCHRNKKTINPRDSKSTPVFQLETAMGSAIECFDNAGGAVGMSGGREREEWEEKGKGGGWCWGGLCH